MCYGTELTSMAILKWTQASGVDWHYVAPGKPQQNAFVESFRRAKQQERPRLSRANVTLLNYG
jgi:putative transposase